MVVVSCLPDKLSVYINSTMSDFLPIVSGVFTYVLMDNMDRGTDQRFHCK